MSMDGSSPHTWGIPAIGQVVVQRYRFIPTYVGHTSRRIVRFASYPVHPHIRGAYLAGSMKSPTKHGSSPHTWGIPAPARPRCPGTRFIPTHVGHTSSEHLPARLSPVHPHTRGAYGQNEVFDVPEGRFIPTHVGHTIGKSLRLCWHPVHPHTRGAYADSQQEVRLHIRFIPTHVGHTWGRRYRWQTTSVHPHTRGAYTGPP